MKFIPFLFIFIFLNNKLATDNLEGTWILEKIDTGEKNLVPEFEYILNLSNGYMSYTHICNRCQVAYKINNNKLSLESAPLCTRIFCGKNPDPIYDYLSPVGNYEVKGDKLIIQNPRAKLIFRKV
ncbi:MAG: META domain-containing protein [Cytophagaceae bacterium]